ncbi:MULTISPECIES: hypothetical protein [Bradyrhizobium]|uniref:hypothetical protein n=1 Tax=Bradyrhizobium TaxID=374 RepID=UPI0018E9EE39|nr:MULTISPECIES: hypothetical protein [Bradyrhizobium]MCK1522315.1 hypothetical protein [Bradyrhizobium sp. 17]MCK1603662.1 hypothetical protein [Bradyrhizobium sp. 166]MCK1690770.1 hypothetical protein [Bradyrhizobium sp. 145]
MSFQNHPGLGEGTKAALDVPIEPVVLSQDMFHLHNGAKQRLARKLVGRLCLTRWLFLSCSSLPHKRSADMEAGGVAGVPVMPKGTFGAARPLDQADRNAEHHTLQMSVSDRGALIGAPPDG